MFTITGKKSYKLQLKDDTWFIDDDQFKGEIISRGNNRFVIIHGNKTFKGTLLTSTSNKKEVVISINGTEHSLKIKDPMDQLIEKMGMSSTNKRTNNVLRAPMPGLILSVNVEEGESIIEGQKLCVLEAMKMENNLKAEHTVEVKEILVKRGETVEKNQILMKFKGTN